MEIKIFGPGCRNCTTLEARTLEALGDLNLTAQVLKVTDIGETALAGVMKTPALAIDGQVVLSGRVPTRRALVKLLESHR